MAPKKKLRVTIIGGGVAGLIAARVLREQHDVVLVERSKGHNEIGAALGIGTTAIKIIERLGFDPQRVKAMVSWTSRVLDKHGAVVKVQDHREHGGEARGDYWLCHRVDVWHEFLYLATGDSRELGIEGEPAKVMFGVDVMDVDVDSGEVKLSDGTTLESDLVIGADGATSICRPLVTQRTGMRHAQPSGFSAFRFMLAEADVKRIRPDSELLNRTRPISVDVSLSMDETSRSVVMYPVRQYEMMNFVCIVPDSMVPRETTASWSAKGSTEDLLRCFEDFGPSVKDLLAHASDVRLWQLREQDPLPTYIRGRTILIGDSAHAMTPHQAQGATQAIEDAEAFELFNDPSMTRDRVAETLRFIDSVRRPRASRVQEGTREMQTRRDPEELYKHALYNRTYPGIRECLRRLDRGEDMIPV